MSEYNTNQDGQWKTSEQWRAEEANDHSNPKKNKNGGRGKYVAKLAASAVAFGLIAGLVMQGVTYGFSRAGIGNGATQLATTKTTSSSSSTSSNDLSGVSKNVMPSIVSITGKFETTSQSWFGQTQSRMKILILTEISTVMIPTDFMISFKDQTIHSKKIIKSLQIQKNKRFRILIGITKTVFCMQQMKIIRDVSMEHPSII